MFIPNFLKKDKRVEMGEIIRSNQQGESTYYTVQLYREQIEITPHTGNTNYKIGDKIKVKSYTFRLLNLEYVEIGDMLFIKN